VTTIGLVDGLRLLRSARRWQTGAEIGRALGWALVVLALPVAALDEGAAGVGIALIGIVQITLWWNAHRASAYLASVPAGPAELRLDHDTLTIVHPMLPDGLTIRFAEVRAVAFDAAPPGHLRARFPITRAPGSRHPLDEPRSFMVDESQLNRGKHGVQLLAISLDLNWWPNVALLFDQETTVTHLGFGQVPQIDPRFPPYAVNRGVVTSDERGLYLRVADLDHLRAELRRHGVREGFTSDDWRHAVGRVGRL
jgi:hypothetical protein